MMKFVTLFDPKSEIDFVGRFKLVGAISLVLPLIMIIGWIIWGMPWGLDFRGGMDMQVKFSKPVEASDIREVLASIDFAQNQVQQFGASQNNEMLIRVERMAALQAKDVEHITGLINTSFPNKGARVHFDEKSGNELLVWLKEPDPEHALDALAKRQEHEAQRKKLADLLEGKSGLELRKSSSSADKAADIYGAVLADEPQNQLIRYTIHFAGISGKVQQALEKAFGTVELRKVDFVDSQVSYQLRTEGLLAVIYALLAIVIYIAIRFDLFFSPGAIITLMIDVMGAMLVFVIGRVDFETPSIAALLTILGYSINNTIVIYDRIREKVPQNPKKAISYEELSSYVNKAINDTLSRTINTTLTVLFATIALWIFASGVIQSFAIVLTVGIIIGAFTSVYVAPGVYLLAKKYLKPHDSLEHHTHLSNGPTREERSRGVV
jgi:preprotein translocase subunit SecF